MTIWIERPLTPAQAQEAKGATGPSGPTGPSGGPSGATGVSGATGAVGVSGATGAAFTGATGVSGATGAIGVSGATGAANATGASGYLSKFTATSTLGNSVIFESGSNVAVGATGPTARLHLAAGTTAAGTAPLKLTDGPLLTSVEPGAIEYKGHTFYATTYLVRRSVVLAQGVIVADVTVADTATETTIYTVDMAADYLTVGKRIKVELNGIFSTVGNNANGVFTLRAKYAGTTIFTIASAQQAATNRPYNMDFYTTCRAIGSGTTGKLKSSGHLSQDITADVLVQGALTNIDTTVTNTLEVTVQWATANASNSFTVAGGDTTCVDDNT